MEQRAEAELIAAVLKGDAASFEPLVAKYSRWASESLGLRRTAMAPMTSRPRE